MPLYSTQSPQQWRPVPKWEGWYEASDLGQVRRVQGYTSPKGPRMLRGTLDRGYRRVALCRHNKPCYFSVHRIVATTFIPNPSNLPEVNHLNGKRGDNRVSNLEWATRSSNAKHGADMGLSPTGERHRCAKLTAASVTFIRNVWGIFSHRELAQRFGVSLGCIKDIQAGRTWKQLLPPPNWKTRRPLPPGKRPAIRWAAKQPRRE
jgi:hypothetical protein